VPRAPADLDFRPAALCQAPTVVITIGVDDLDRAREFQE
jgi:hypothetical protein